MPKRPSRQEQLTSLLIVLGATIVFGPVIWLLERWREALARDPSNARGAQWLSEQLSAHPYLTLGALLLGVAFSGGLVMLILFSLAKWLTSRHTDRMRSD